MRFNLYRNLLKISCGTLALGVTKKLSNHTEIGKLGIKNIKDICQMSKGNFTVNLKSNPNLLTIVNFNQIRVKSWFSTFYLCQ